MSGIIKLLPDHVANQIAAGEVVQRPASAVKEMLENAIDAGATEIQLIIKDAGRTLIQVVDNGHGMAPEDARMCFERHATSKIDKAEDLFGITSLGFRGEALASIASVSQTELRTKREEDELGTHVVVNGGKFDYQEACAIDNGTSISVKNLFYNIPARRKFLKSNKVEMRHIVDEFQRVAMARPNLRFVFIEDDNEKYHLEPGNLKQRIVALYGNHYNSKLLAVEQETEIIRVHGFIGKPESARKTRGEQFFFVNDRYFKHPYFHHAAVNAFNELIPENSFPSYFVFLEIDPALIDVNIHPTKTEINFQENQLVYAMIHSAVKQTLGKNNLAPTLDFDKETSFADYFPKDKQLVPPRISHNENYNPFEQPTPKKSPTKFLAGDMNKTLSQSGWENIFDTTGRQESMDIMDSEDSDIPQASTTSEQKVFQLHGKYIVTSLKSGLLIIDQRKAHQRVIFEEFIRKMGNGGVESQQLLFPISVKISQNDTLLLEEMSGQLKTLGFNWSLENNEELSFSSIPANIPENLINEVIDGLFEDWKEGTENMAMEHSTRLARIVSKRIATRYGTHLEQLEMQSLIDRLFSCEKAEVCPSGNKTFVIIKSDEISGLFDQ